MHSVESGGINNFARQQRFQPTLHRKYPESLGEILRGKRVWFRKR